MDIERKNLRNEGYDIIRALGVEVGEQCVRFSLTMEVGSQPVLEITRRLSSDEVDAMVEHIQAYEKG